MSEIFEAYIYCPNDPDDTSGVTIKLPATAYEILDGLERAHITDGAPYMEVMSERLDCLSEMIEPTADLYELNHLAERLSAMSDWELDCFEGMVLMETAKTANSPIALERLINFTHSMGDCQIVYEAHDDQSLGKFYVDNDVPVIPPDLPEILYDMLDYESIGRKARMGEGAESLCGGVFTEKGYVVQNGEIADHYHSGDAILKEKPQYTIMLEVCIAHSCNERLWHSTLATFIKTIGRADFIKCFTQIVAIFGFNMLLDISFTLPQGQALIEGISHIVAIPTGVKTTHKNGIRYRLCALNTLGMAMRHFGRLFCFVSAV